MTFPPCDEQRKGGDRQTDRQTEKFRRERGDGESESETKQKRERRESERDREGGGKSEEKREMLTEGEREKE